MAWKYAWIFVSEHYLFIEASSFARAQLEENCVLWGTDNVHGQISEYIFMPNGGYCVYFPSSLFCNMDSLENCAIFSDISHWQLKLGIFHHMTCLAQSAQAKIFHGLWNHNNHLMTVWYSRNRRFCFLLRTENEFSSSQLYLLLADKKNCWLPNSCVQNNKNWPLLAA